MRKIWNILFFAFFVFCLFLFKPRQDIVFGAVDESVYIRLFENGNDFELGIEDQNTFKGTYTILEDTVFLSYQEAMNRLTNSPDSWEQENNGTLPKKLFINNNTSRIRSTDGQLFSAEIYVDMREKPYPRQVKGIMDINALKTGISAVGLMPDTQLEK